MIRKFPKPDDRSNNICKYLIFFYLLIDFIRIQDLVPIGFMRPGLLTIVAMLVFVVSRRETGMQVKEIRLMWYFLFLLCVYVPFARNGNYAYRTAKSFAMFLPFILVVFHYVKDLSKLKFLINLLVVITIYICLSAFSGVGKGTGGYFADENDLALYVNMIIPINYFLFIQKGQSIKGKLFYGISLVLCLSAIVVSFSRGGFVGLVAVGFMLWIYGKKKITSAVIITLLTGGIYLVAGDAYINEMSSVSDIQESTAQARIQSWISAWHMFLDNPWGVGGNNFQVLFPEYQTDWFKKGMWGRVAHSIWFTLLPELGVIGVFIYFNLIKSVFGRLFKIRKMNLSAEDEEISLYLKSIASALVVGLVGYFTSGSLLSVLYYPYFWYFSVITVVLYDIAYTYDSNIKPAK